MVGITIIIGVIGIALIGLLALVLASWYTIVPANEAHVVISGGETKVYSSNNKYSSEGKSAYFSIPEWFFLFKLGKSVHKMPLEILPINVPDFLAFDKERARFVCNIIAYVYVSDPIAAATRFSGNVEELAKQISEKVQGTTRDATTKKNIRELINDRNGIIEQVEPSLKESIKEWGLELEGVELVEFKDPIKSDSDDSPSHVIADISSMVEEEINSEARQKNADRRKVARIKEAEAEEIARLREVQRDETVAKREQDKNRAVAEQEKLAREKELDVKRVDEVKNQEIAKEKAKIFAEQEREVEQIKKEQKKLEGEGDRLRAEEKAKGEAAPIREKGLAEAEAKEKLQAALNKFEDKAIRALTAELEVQMRKEVGVAGAKALEKADVRLFSGGEKDGGFDLGKMISAVSVANDDASSGVINRLARPNDLGLTALGLKKVQEEKESAKGGA